MVEYEDVKKVIGDNIQRMQLMGESHLMLARWLTGDIMKLLSEKSEAEVNSDPIYLVSAVVEKIDDSCVIGCRAWVGHHKSQAEAVGVAIEKFMDGGYKVICYEAALCTNLMNHKSTYETCDNCNGSGLALNVRGDPDECPQCKGNTVVEQDNQHDSFFDFVIDGIMEAEKAMKKYPQPNYIISKIAEEAGEVVKAAIHCAEGREEAENVRGEMRQLIAMLYRLWVEGDQVHGLSPVRSDK